MKGVHLCDLAITDAGALFFDCACRWKQDILSWRKTNLNLPQTEKITFNLDNPKEKNPKNKYLIDVYFVDLLNLESKTKGMNTLKAL